MSSVQQSQSECNEVGSDVVEVRGSDVVRFPLRKLYQDWVSWEGLKAHLSGAYANVHSYK